MAKRVNRKIPPRADPSDEIVVRVREALKLIKSGMPIEKARKTAHISHTYLRFYENHPLVTGEGK